MPEKMLNKLFVHLISSSYLDYINLLSAGLTLLHSERPKLYGVLAVLSAIELR